MVRQEGVLKKWNEDKGFGFIRPSNGGRDIFVHISSFPKDGVPPRLEERISYEIIQTKDGKVKADFLSRLDLITHEIKTKPRAKPYPPRRKKQSKPSTLSRILIVLASVTLVLIIIYQAHQSNQRKLLQNMPNENAFNIIKESQNGQIKISKNITSTNYTCDGRIHCSEMHSCEEAKYFINHCPSTKMDGDHDGMPCEDTVCAGKW